MSVQISNSATCIVITINSVNRWTLPKRETLLEVDGSQLHFRNSGEYVEAVEFSDVTSPVTANIEALRTAVNNYLTT